MPILKAARCGLLAALALTSCSRGGGDEAPLAAERQIREFSQQDKLAARSLSLASKNIVEQANGSYAQALLCNLAIDTIAERLRGAGSLGATQLNELAEAESQFDRRLRALGKQENKSEADIRNDLERAAADNPDASANARVALACLQGQT
jgi:hypothetical protein